MSKLSSNRPIFLPHHLGGMTLHQARFHVFLIIFNFLELKCHGTPCMCPCRKTNYFIFARQLFFMKFSTKLGKINLMRLIIKANTDNLFLTTILTLSVFKKGLPKIMGQKSSCGELRTRKISRVFYFPTQDFNISKNLNW